eukprot:3502786-Alexandrium_andersonii.AAC.1
MFVLMGVSCLSACCHSQFQPMSTVLTHATPSRQVVQNIANPPHHTVHTVTQDQCPSHTHLSQPSCKHTSSNPPSGFVSEAIWAEPSKMVKTSACDKSPDEHAIVLARHITKKSFIEYPGFDAPLDKNKILSCKRLWKDLKQELGPNLNFKDSVLQQALTKVHKQVGASWPKPLLQDDVPSWAKA